MVMKKLFMAAVVGSALMLNGCQPTAEEVAVAKVKSERNLSSPDVVGTLPDGRRIRHVEVVIPNQWSHHIYFVDNATVSTNYGETHGKTATMQTRVTLSSNPTNEEIIAAGEELKQQQKAADEAELARLQKKLGIQ